MFRAVKRLLVFLIVLSFFVLIFSQGHVYEKDELEYGVTFSKKQAEDLGLDWKKLYIDIFEDLGVKKIRLPAYWDEIEKEKDLFDFEDLDWLIENAEEKEAEVILAVGGRLPRWPECHFPEWVEKLDGESTSTGSTPEGGQAAQEKEILDYIDTVVKRYKDKKNIIAWQVENEPFLTHFGQCPKLNRKLLDDEITLVRALDDRPIIVTDSGELSFWIAAAKRADIFGTTMYLHTYSGNLKRYINYPIAPGFFQFKKNITRLFAKPQDWIVIELQAEPWASVPFQDASEEERVKTMNLEKFRNIIEFSSLTGFKEFYLWGVEWWYWERAQGRTEIWNEAKTLFNTD